MRLTEIYRYPVKGFAPEPLEHIAITADQPIPGDRQFALAHAATKFDAENPAWVKRNNFVVVALSPLLAGIETRYDPNTHHLDVRDEAGVWHAFDLDSPAETQSLCTLIEAYTGAAQPGPFQLATLPESDPIGHLADRDVMGLSIANHATHAAVSTSAGMDLSNRRWRANLWIDGAEAWEEFNWVGKTLTIGDTQFEVLERITRCAATSASPETGTRDINMVRHLDTIFDHQDFGILVRPITSGALSVGADITVG